VDIRIWGQNLPIDGKLREALPLQHKRLVKLANRPQPSAPPDSWKPLSQAPNPGAPSTPKQPPAFLGSGKINFEALVRRQENAEDYNNRYIIYFHDATVRYDIFPYPLENVAGVLDVQEDHWEFRDFRGSYKGGAFTASGTCHPRPDGDHINVEL